MRQYEPGSWIVVETTACRFLLDKATGLYLGQWLDKEAASLIAAAPDMLAALHAALCALESRPEPTVGLVSNEMQQEWRRSLDSIRAAIAKAEGSQHTSTQGEKK